MNVHCKRCGHEFEYKYLLLKHLNRKKSCEPTKSDISVDLLIDEIDESKNKKYSCRACFKKFKSFQTRWYHEKTCEKISEKTEEKIEEKPVQKNNQIVDIDNLKKYLLKEIKNEVVKKTENEKNLEKNIKTLNLELQYYKNRKNENFYQLLLENFLGGTHKKLKSGITDITTDYCHAEIKQWKSFKEAIGQLTCYNIQDPKPELHLYFFGKYSAKERTIELIKECNKFKIFSCEDLDDGVRIIDCITNEEVYKYKAP